LFKRRETDAESAQNIHCLVSGVEDWQYRIETDDVKDLLDRLLQATKDNFAAHGTETFGRHQKDWSPALLT
jgi:hypothetical protein